MIVDGNNLKSFKHIKTIKHNRRTCKIYQAKTKDTKIYGGEDGTAYDMPPIAMLVPPNHLENRKEYYIFVTHNDYMKWCGTNFTEVLLHEIVHFINVSSDLIAIHHISEDQDEGIAYAMETLLKFFDMRFKK